MSFGPKIARGFVGRSGDISRRDFLTLAGAGAGVVAAGVLAAVFARFMQPGVVTDAPGPVEAGLPEQYAPGSLTFVAPAQAYLGRDGRGFYAIIAICTHLGCTPRLDGAVFVCPCHGSRFTRDGAVLNGPAARPLDRAFVGLAADGRLVIDRSRLVPADYRLKV